VKRISKKVEAYKQSQYATIEASFELGHDVVGLRDYYNAKKKKLKANKEPCISWEKYAQMTDARLIRPLLFNITQVYQFLVEFEAFRYMAAAGSQFEPRHSKPLRVYIEHHPQAYNKLVTKVNKTFNVSLLLY
jgi:hypothetical protein